MAVSSPLKNSTCAAALIGKSLLLSHKDLRIDFVRDLEQRGETAASANIDIRTAGRPVFAENK